MEDKGEIIIDQAPDSIANDVHMKPTCKTCTQAHEFVESMKSTMTRVPYNY